MKRFRCVAERTTSILQIGISYPGMQDGGQHGVENSENCPEFLSTLDALPTILNLLSITLL